MTKKKITLYMLILLLLLFSIVLTILIKGINTDLQQKAVIRQFINDVSGFSTKPQALNLLYDKSVSVEKISNRWVGSINEIKKVSTIPVNERIIRDKLSNRYAVDKIEVFYVNYTLFFSENSKIVESKVDVAEFFYLEKSNDGSYKILYCDSMQNP